MMSVHGAAANAGQRKEAIELPLAVWRSHRPGQRLLNDAGDEPDQLPILQHA